MKIDGHDMGEACSGFSAQLKRLAKTPFIQDRSPGPALQQRAIALRGGGDKENLPLILFAALVLFASGFLFIFRDHVFGASEHIVLSLQGSTSLGDELMPHLAAAFLRDEMGAEQTGFRIAGRDTKGHSYLHVWGKVPGRPDLQVIEIYAAGSGAAFRCLATESGKDSCDIGMASRPINKVDKEIYPALVNLEVRTNEHVVALDGIAIRCRGLR